MRHLLIKTFAAFGLPIADPGALPKGLRDPFDRDAAIEVLARFSLLRAEPTGVIVHRLVQAVTRDGLDKATTKARVAAAVRLVDAALPDPQEHTNWPAIGTLLPHALAAAEAAEQLGAGLESAATVLNETARYHHARGAYAEAEPLFKRAVAIDKKVLGPAHPATATNLANLCQDTSRLAEAEPLLKRALAIGEKALGPDHPTVAIRLNNLAGLYWATGRLAEAEPLLRRVLAILEKGLPANHPTLAKVRENYAILLDELGRAEEAATLRAKAGAPP